MSAQHAAQSDPASDHHAGDHAREPRPGAQPGHPLRDEFSVGAPVVVLNQYYVPDVASTGQLLHELAATLAEHGVQTKVVASRPSYGPPETWKDCPYSETFEGVEIRRLWTTRFSKDNIVGRVANFTTFIVQLQLRILFSSRADHVYLYTTNPPFLGILGAVASKLRRHRYVVLLHDAHPRIGVLVNKIREGGIVERMWEWVNRVKYRNASQAIVLCQKAKELVVQRYGIDPRRVHIIPNWADGQKLFPKPKQQCEFTRKHKLQNDFVVLYSGNLGLYYDFETILDAAEILKTEGFKFVFVGAGGRKAWIAEQIQKRQLTNAMLLDYVPIEQLNDSLNSCDASVVSIAKGVEGVSFPSKLYSSLAVGKPIVSISEPVSELRDVCQQHEVGIWAKVGDGQGLADGLRMLKGDPEGNLRRGAAARSLFENRYTKQASVQAYAEVLRLAAEDRVTDHPINRSAMGSL